MQSYLNISYFNINLSATFVDKMQLRITAEVLALRGYCLRPGESPNYYKPIHLFTLFFIKNFIPPFIRRSQSGSQDKNTKQKQ